MRSAGLLQIRPASRLSTSLSGRGAPLGVVQGRVRTREKMAFPAAIPEGLGLGLLRDAPVCRGSGASSEFAGPRRGTGVLRARGCGLKASCGFLEAERVAGRAGLWALHEGLSEPPPF